ncbi:MAG: hypothetical protein IPH31_22030 [Lewinellaceae bacterium]|nr:hypothetical protein [Lewinellaceae bacterium]
MKKPAIILIIAFLSTIIGLVCTNCRAIHRNTDSKPVTHEIWDNLVKKHVDANGFVDYKGFIRDSVARNQYLHLLETAHPSDKKLVAERTNGLLDQCL